MATHVIREKMRNTIKVNCTGIDLTTCSNIEFYMRQARFYGCYTPVVLSPTEMVVDIPCADAEKLTCAPIEMQFAFVDANGIPDASDVVAEEVCRLIKDGVYDPI